MLYFWEDPRTSATTGCIPFPYILRYLPPPWRPWSLPDDSIIGSVAAIAQLREDHHPYFYTFILLYSQPLRFRAGWGTVIRRVERVGGARPQPDLGTDPVARGQHVFVICIMTTRPYRSQFSVSSIHASISADSMIVRSSL